MLHSIYSTNSLSSLPSSARSSRKLRQYHPQTQARPTAIASHARQMKTVPSVACPLSLRKKRLSSAKQPAVTMCIESASSSGRQRKERRGLKSHAHSVGHLGRAIARMSVNLRRRVMSILKAMSMLRLSSGLVDDETTLLIIRSGSSNNVAEEWISGTVTTRVTGRIEFSELSCGR